MVMGYRTCCERRFWSKLASFNTQAQRFCETRSLRQAQRIGLGQGAGDQAEQDWRKKARAAALRGWPGA
jgi:hypothetical protein